MTTRHILRLSTGCLIALAIAATFTNQAAATKGCGRVEGGAADEIRASHTSCHEASSVARRALVRVEFPPSGGDWKIDARIRFHRHRWKCSGRGFSPLPVSCRRGHAWIRFDVWPESDAVATRNNSKFLVPVSRSRTGFGPFRESAGSNSASVLRRIYGKPKRAKVVDRYGCKMNWPRLGLVVQLTTYGLVNGPCKNGLFNRASMSSKRWHTSAGVKPGGSAHLAKKHSVRNCLHRDSYKCAGVKGYVLGLHPSDCAAGLFPTVTARVKHGRVRSLEVFKHSCE